MVERAAVNRDVEGSSPSSGAIFQLGGLFETRAWLIFVLATG